MSGSELRALRRRAGLLAVELAAKLKVSQSAVTRWEAETRPITPSREIQLRYLLGAAPATKRGQKETESA